MTLTEIKEQVEEEKHHLEESLKAENQELKLYQDFFEKYSLIDVKKYDQIDCGKFFVLYLHSTNPEKWPIKELEELVKSNQLLFLKANSDSFRNIINAVRFMIETKDADAIKELMQEKVNPIKPTLFDKLFRRKKLKNEPIKPTLFNKMFRRKELEQEVVKNILDELKKVGCDIEKILDLLEKEDRDLKEALSLVKMMKDSVKFKESVGEKLNIFLKLSNIKASKEDVQKVSDKSWEAIIDKKRLFKALDVMKKYYEKLVKQDASRKRNSNKQMRDYQKFEQLFLKMQEGGEIKNATAIAEKIANPTLRLEVLKYIYSHNLSIQEQIESKYKSISQDESTDYKIFLIQNTLSTDNLESLMTKSISELEAMLEELRKLNIKDIEIILETSSLSRVQELKLLSKQGVITEEFLRKNTSLFQLQQPHYQVLTMNRRILQGNRINPNTINKHQEILFATPANLERNFSTLQEYSLPLNWMSLESAQFLKHPNLARKIDRILELGYETLLENDIELLNYEDSAWERLEVLKSLNIPLPTAKNEVEGILESPHFIVSEEEQKRYLETPTPYIKRKDIRDIVPVSALPMEQETKRTYTIGGVIFSKPKVIRNLSQVLPSTSNEIIFACITAGTNMQENEYQRVKKELTNYHRK